MSGTRLTITIVFFLFTAGTALPGPIFNRKPKTDPARFKQLADALRTDPDERKRKAAVAEIRDFDPRTTSEVFPTLVTALQNDPSQLVRAEVAEAIGQFKTVSPVAGLALETAAEADPSRDVREIAKQALWEYHLNGYRSAKGSDGIVGQTAEPTIAKRTAPKPPIRLIADAVISPIAIVPRPDSPLPISTSPLKPTSTEPKVTVTQPASRQPTTLITWIPPSQLNVTAEPPRAKR